MPSNKIIIASAGSGKTSRIIDDVIGSPQKKCAAITYTINNRSEITGKAIQALGYLPENLVVSTWYAFILRHFVRPYQRCLITSKIIQLRFVNGRSVRYVPEAKVPDHFCDRNGKIYIDKASKLACRLIERTDGLPLQRFENIFDRLYVDESQDLAGYDLLLIEYLMKSGVEVHLVGDHRQATFSTNNAGKYNQYRGAKIVDLFHKWEESGLSELEYQNISHRCVQSICDFADLLNPKLPKTDSKNEAVTGHDGIFFVKKSDLVTYFQTFNPQTLRYSRAHKDLLGNPINFGEAKGMTFDRSLVYPHNPLLKYLTTGNVKDAGKEIPKVYVATTRARQSTAFAVPDNFGSDLAPFWSP